MLAECVSQLVHVLTTQHLKYDLRRLYFAPKFPQNAGNAVSATQPLPNEQPANDVVEIDEVQPPQKNIRKINSPHVSSVRL